MGKREGGRKCILGAKVEPARFSIYIGLTLCSFSERGGFQSVSPMYASSMFSLTGCGALLATAAGAGCGGARVLIQRPGE